MERKRQGPSWEAQFRLVVDFVDLKAAASAGELQHSRNIAYIQDFLKIWILSGPQGAF